MSENPQIQRPGDILIDSNWPITIGMVVLFALTAFYLGWSIRDTLLDKIPAGVPQAVHNEWFDRVNYVLGAILFFIFGFSFPPKHLKVAFLMWGTKYTALVALSYMHTSTSVQYSAGLAMAIASQAAYSIILFSIVRWFKTVARRVPRSHSGIRDS